MRQTPPPQRSPGRLPPLGLLVKWWSPGLAHPVVQFDRPTDAVGGPTLFQLAVENKGGIDPDVAFEGPVDDADPMNKPPAKTNVERTPAGLQIVLPGCERRTLPRSTTRVDEGGQGLLHFYQPPSLREQLETRSELPLRSNKGQRAMSMSGLFGS